jgi:Mu-like prophage major head subunit gpT
MPHIPFTEVVKNYGDITRGGNIHVEGQMIDHGSSFQRPVIDLQQMSEGAGFNATFTGERGELTPAQWRARLAGRQRAVYEARLFNASKIILRGLTGSKRDRLNLEEALSISDFPNLFGDVIDRAVLANYIETPYTWNQVAYASEVSDFRPVKRFRVDGGTGLLGNTSLNPVPTNPGSQSGTGPGFDANNNLIPIDMGGQYPEDKLTDALYTYRLNKYGKRMPFFWETFVDDDLNALKDTPARFGRGARRSEEYFVTKLYAGNLTFFSNTNANLVNATNAGGAFTAVNPALTIEALQQAIVVLMNQKDTTGQPISVEAMTLVVPPSLKTVAMNILNSDYVWMADQGGTTSVYGSNTAAFGGNMLHAQNWARNIVRLAVNYYLPLVDTVTGTTGWYLFSNPENGRPAIEFGRLRGHTTPELYMKLPNSVAIGEGTMGPGPGIIPGTTNMNPMEGDFDTDSVNYKIRHIFGGTTIDPIMAVFSKGTGSA